jgi:DNA-binding NtrC family response regulator
VIDDELALGQILQRALSRDYDVTLLTHGRDAIALLSAADTPGFDLILCDLMMPDVNGEDVFETVTRAEPDLAKRFVFMTGGAFTPRAQRFLAEQSAVVLEKPFDMATARDLLDAELARLSVSD